MAEWWKWALGLGGAAVVLTWGSSASADTGGDMQDIPLFGPSVFDWSTLNDWAQRLQGGAVPHAADIVNLAQTYMVHPALVAAIPTLESGDWKVGDSGVGDDGHGHRWWQIDDRSHGDFLASHPDPGDFGVDGDYAIGSVLVPAYQYAIAHGISDPMASRFAIAGYNAGVGGAMRALQNSGDPNNATWHAAYLPAIYSRMKPLL